MNKQIEVKNNDHDKCKGAEKLVKTCPKSPKTAKWPNLDSFFFISHHHCTFFNFCLFSVLHVICAVILNTLNLCFLTKNILTPLRISKFSDPPYRGGLPKKKCFMVKHNLDNHFQGVKHKFSINLISAPLP